MGEVEREAKILERIVRLDMSKCPDIVLYELARLGAPYALEELRRRRKRRKPLDLDL